MLFVTLVLFRVLSALSRPHARKAYFWIFTSAAARSRRLSRNGACSLKSLNSDYERIFALLSPRIMAKAGAESLTLPGSLKLVTGWLRGDIGWTFRKAPTAPRKPSCRRNVATISPWKDRNTIKGLDLLLMGKHTSCTFIQEEEFLGLIEGALFYTSDIHDSYGVLRYSQDNHCQEDVSIIMDLALLCRQ